MPLYRYVKRRASLEADADLIYQNEFVDDSGEADKSLSLYELNDCYEVVQACTEHAASVPLGPPGTRAALLILPPQTAVMVSTPATGANSFQFRSGRHREWSNATENELRTQALDIFLSRPLRQVSFVNSVAKEYLATVRSSNDAEWVAVFNSSSNWQKFG